MLHKFLETVSVFSDLRVVVIAFSADQDKMRSFLPRYPINMDSLPESVARHIICLRDRKARAPRDWIEIDPNTIEATGRLLSMYSLRHDRTYTYVGRKNMECVLLFLKMYGGANISQSAIICRLAMNMPFTIIATMLVWRGLSRLYSKNGNVFVDLLIKSITDAVSRHLATNYACLGSLDNRLSVIRIPFVPQDHTVTDPRMFWACWKAIGRGLGCCWLATEPALTMR